MNKLKVYYPTIETDSYIDQHLEPDRSDRLYNEFSSKYQSVDAEVHWMANASYNFAPESRNKPSKK